MDDALEHIDVYADYFQSLLGVQREAEMEADKVWEYTRLHAKLLTSEPSLTCDLLAYYKIDELIEFLSFLQDENDEPFWDLESGWGLVAAHSGGRTMMRQGDCGSLASPRLSACFPSLSRKPPPSPPRCCPMAGHSRRRWRLLSGLIIGRITVAASRTNGSR